MSRLFLAALSDMRLATAGDEVSCLGNGGFAPGRMSLLVDPPHEISSPNATAHK